MKNNFLKVKLLFLLVLTFGLSGCFWLLVGGAGGAGGAIYYKGRIVHTVNAYYTKVHKASLSALKGMGLPIYKDQLELNKSNIESSFLDDTKIWIEIEGISRHTSKIYIRVGLLGDEARSRELLKKILARL